MATLDKVTSDTERVVNTLSQTNSHHAVAVTTVNNNTSQEKQLNETKLSNQEVNHLYSVMQRAKKFEEEELFEGQLYKYTNVVKGWQYRWFVINLSRGTLEYYMLEERKKSSPRGCVYLMGCQIIPSDEDSQTFTVNAACGEVYKLKAVDAKSRQIWVNKLRMTALTHENNARDLAASQGTNGQVSSKVVLPTDSAVSKATLPNKPAPHVNPVSTITTDLKRSLDSARSELTNAKKSQSALVDLIRDMTSSDEDLLLIKITSHAAITTLEECLTILDSV